MGKETTNFRRNRKDNKALKKKVANCSNRLTSTGYQGTPTVLLHIAITPKVGVI